MIIAVMYALKLPVTQRDEKEEKIKCYLFLKGSDLYVMICMCRGVNSRGDSSRVWNVLLGVVTLGGSLFQSLWR